MYQAFELESSSTISVVGLQIFFYQIYESKAGKDNEEGKANTDTRAQEFKFWERIKNSLKYLFLLSTLAEPLRRKRYPHPTSPRRLKHRTYPWLHLSFNQYVFRQLSHPPQPPYHIHRQLHLSWPTPPVSQIHTQRSQTHSSLITYRGR
jgi:hypothetical protein